MFIAADLSEEQKRVSAAEIDAKSVFVGNVFAVPLLSNSLAEPCCYCDRLESPF